jgi:ABC-2 type transport system permease protein
VTVVPAEMDESMGAEDKLPSARRGSFAREVMASLRLDLAEVLRSRWMVFCALVYAVLAAILVLVGLRESTLMGFTGAGRVLMAFSQALTLVLPLLALTATGQVVGRARDEGTLELLLAQPIRRSAWITGVTLTRFGVLFVPLLVLVVALGLVANAAGQAVPWPFVWRVLGVSAALLWAFVGIGMALSVFVRNQARAITYVVLVWALAVALLDFGLVALLLKWRIDAEAVFLLAALNPVQDARLALLSGLDAELGTLGPVGVYLSTRLGQDALFVIGLVWPAVLGTLAWLSALFGFRRNDVI